MWRLTFTNLWARKRRLVGASTAVVLGVAFLFATLVVSDTLRAGFDTLFTEANAGTDVVVRNATVIGGDETEQRGLLDGSLADRLEDVPGVAVVLPSIEGVAQIVGADGEALGGDGPPTFGANWIAHSDLNPYRLVEGRAPSAAGEVVIDRASANNGDLRIGSTTTVKTPAPTDVTVVGIATFGSSDSMGPTTFVAFTDGQARELFSSGTSVSSFVMAGERGVDADQLRAAVTGVLPDGAEALTGTELSAEQLADIESDFLGFIEVFLLAFAGVALLVATFSIQNTLSILVAQRTRESALLRAVGASRRQVLLATTGEALAIGVAASLVGLAAGYGLGIGLRALISGLGVDLPGDVVISSGSVMAAVTVGVVVTLIAGIAPAVRASRVAPLAALRDAAIDRSAVSVVRAVAGVLVTAGGVVLTVLATSQGDSAFARAGLGSLVVVVGAVILGPVATRPVVAVLGAPVRALRGETGRLATRNATRNPRRTAATASALLVGTAVVALFATLGSSITASIEETVDANFGGDLVIVEDSFSGAGIDPRVAPAIEVLPDVEVAAALANAAVTIDGADSVPTVADPERLDAVLDLGVTAGSLADLAPGELAVSEHEADHNGWALGDDVVVGFADGTATPFTISVIYETRDLIGDVVMATEDWLPHAPSTGDVAVLIDLVDGADTAAVAGTVDALSATYAAPDAQTRDEYVDSVASEIEQLLAVVYGLLGLAVLIALLGIANTLALSIHERRRELGLLRALGQTRAQLRSTVRWEAVITAVFGTIGGVGLGVGLGWGLVRAIEAQEGMGTFTAPWPTLAIVVAAAAVAGTVAAVRPARRAARTDVIAALAGE
jgi:putative ABC transport system permease protein